MLKETETEETIVFFVTFLSLVAFQLGEGPGPLIPLPLTTPMLFSIHSTTGRLDGRGRVGAIVICHFFAV